MDFSNYLRDTFDFANSPEFKKCCKPNGQWYTVSDDETCIEGRDCPKNEDLEKRKKAAIEELMNDGYAKEVTKLHKKIYGY